MKKLNSDGSGSDTIAKQAARLVKSNLRERPKSSVELERVLRRCSKGLAHVTAVVDHVIDTLERCPTPTELAAIAAQVAKPVRAEAAAGELCGQCVDGQRPIWLLVPCRGGIPIVAGAERITEAQYRDLSPEREPLPLRPGETERHRRYRVSPKLDPRTQALYMATEACPCRIGRF